MKKKEYKMVKPIIHLRVTLGYNNKKSDTFCMEMQIFLYALRLFVCLGCVCILFAVCRLTLQCVWLFDMFVR